MITTIVFTVVYFVLIRYFTATTLYIHVFIINFRYKSITSIDHICSMYTLLPIEQSSY